MSLRVLSTLILILGIACSSPTTGPEFIKLFSKTDNIACYRIPALATAPNGDLIAAIDERVPSCADLRDNRDINIVIRRSSDNGENWTEIERIADYPEGQSASDPSLIVDYQSKEIFLFFNYMDLDKEPNVYYFKVMSTRDNGKTWSKPRDITSAVTGPDMKEDFKFITSGRGIQARDGTLYHTIVNLQRGVYVFGSKDHGRTWFFMDTPLTPGDESKIVELENGQLMVNSRVNRAGLRYVHTTGDGGHSWQSRPDSTLVDPSCNASLLYVPGTGVLYFSNLDSPSERKNLVLRRSTDLGMTWHQKYPVYSGSAAYSSMTLLQDGSLGIFFESNDYTDNQFIMIDPEWLDIENK